MDLTDTFLYAKVLFNILVAGIIVFDIVANFFWRKFVKGEVLFDSHTTFESELSVNLANIVVFTAAFILVFIIDILNVQGDGGALAIVLLIVDSLELMGILFILMMPKMVAVTDKGVLVGIIFYPYSKLRSYTVSEKNKRAIVKKRAGLLGTKLLLGFPSKEDLAGFVEAVDDSIPLGLGGPQEGPEFSLDRETVKEKRPKKKQGKRRRKKDE